MASNSLDGRTPIHGNVRIRASLAVNAWQTARMRAGSNRNGRLWFYMAVFMLAAVISPRIAAAADTPVDLELVIAVDVSVSMDLEDQMLQREGFIAAFRDRDVVAAIQRGRLGRIAVTYVEWSGSYLQWVRAPWTLVSGPESAHAFAESIHSSFFTRRYLTSMSGALIFSSTLFATNGFSSQRQVIDISGDGPNNNGAPVNEARDHVVAQGITINGLPILQPEDKVLGFFEIDHIDRYYRDCVIGGDGAFTLPVRAGGGIVEGIKRKLVLEIAGAAPRPSVRRASYMPAVGMHRTDCRIGEKLLRQWWDSTEHE